MPKANFDDWTPCEVIAQKIGKWASGEDRPQNGALVSIFTKDKKTDFVVNQ